MDPVTIMALASGFIKMAFSIWSSARKVMGKEEIPTWDELVSKNIDLQAKIDAEKE